MTKLPCLRIIKSPPPEEVDGGDEPVTPAGRLFLRPEMDTIIHCAIGVEHHMDVEAVKSTVKESLMVKHPRFSSLLVRHGTREYWRPTEVDVDRHFIVVDPARVRADADDVDRAVNEYVAELSVSTPMPTDKPLWEIHVMVALRCAVFRIHHALGDGVSLMSLLLACCRDLNDQSSVPKLAPLQTRRLSGSGGRGSVLGCLGRVMASVMFSLIFCLEFVLRCLQVRDRRTVVSGGIGVELWPRRIATAKFFIDDMKQVKKAVTEATINDVLFGVISAGLSKYLDHRTGKRKSLKDGLRITGVAMFNLREHVGLQDLTEMMKNNSRARWGNKFGMLILPVHYHRSGVDPLDFVRRAKKMIDRKKRSIEAHFSYSVGKLVMSLLGTKFASLLNYRILCNTTFTFSNVLGPKEEITIAGNPVKFIRVTTSSLPHALTMHMLSYAGRAEMQVMVAKDIIPDPEFLAKCFEDALFQMKEAAVAVAGS